MKYTTIIFLVTSLIVTVFLFYIDEGNYHLDGILKPANLVPLGIYFTGIFMAKFILFRFIQPRTSAIPGLIMTVFIGSFIGTLLSVGFFLGLSALRTFG